MTTRDRLIVIRTLAHYYLWLAFTADLNPFEHSRHKQAKKALGAFGVTI